MIKDPDAPAPIPKFRTARANLEHVVYDSKGFGGRGGLANPIGGYSDAVILARVLLTYDRYWPAVQDYEDPLTQALKKSLAESKIPVLAFSSTNIGPRWSQGVKNSAAATGAAPEVRSFPDGAILTCYAALTPKSRCTRRRWHGSGCSMR